ncbi:MAG: hypothetical protein AVDCRST_MAG58-318, partial [uncultured Rubrobacteraceae bacterium]
VLWKSRMLLQRGDPQPHPHPRPRARPAQDQRQQYRARHGADTLRPGDDRRPRVPRAAGPEHLLEARRPPRGDRPPRRLSRLQRGRLRDRVHLLHGRRAHAERGTRGL